MHAHDVRSTAGFRFGTYLCLRLSAPVRSALSGERIPALAAELGLRNEFEPGVDHPAEAIAFLRRGSAQGRVGERRPAIEDSGLSDADVVVHVAANSPEPAARFRAELARLVAPDALRVLSGVVRPPNYTGTAMHNFAYAHRVLQQPAARMPNAFLMPLSKTEAWWRKTWMERHTYFLPRYSEGGQMQAEGHALVCEPGITSLLRRTYKQESEPAPAGVYDFINYFECADEHVATFHAVCDALREVRRNPEWRFVLEGPTWHGRRVASWQELLA